MQPYLGHKVHGSFAAAIKMGRKDSQMRSVKIAGAVVAMTATFVDRILGGPASAEWTLCPNQPAAADAAAAGEDAEPIWM